VTPAGELQVSDLDSTNGTYVNRRRVERATLVAGDTLTVGRMDLTVERAACNEEG
jgi:pSer/pThr/pTyr-binding forkhead associated (FHA) protein